jgi:hypothetical protein
VNKNETRAVSELASNKLIKEINRRKIQFFVALERVE